jgi:single-stranded-DNA-specific exonuclease
MRNYDNSQKLSLNHKRWSVLNTDSVSSILDILIANRQITDLDAFLNPNFETDLHDPFLIPDMEKAIEMIRWAQKEHRKVMIMGDYDADGITGTALLYEMFKAIGIPQVICRLPHRIHDGYGFQPHIIKEAVRDQVDVIFTVDNGVSSHEAIALAKQQGIHVVICDHHAISETLPPADAILHPKRSDSVYPFKDLTGVGVAFKLAQAVCPRLMPSNKAESFLKWSLDLVAIGTVADCATVMGENRILIKYGLLVIGKTKRPGLQYVLKQCMGKNPTYDTTLIGFRIAPRINAAGRLSHPDSSLKLLLTTDVIEAELLARELQELNMKRQERTLQAVEQAKEQLQDEIGREKILIAKNKAWHPGIVGLIAGRLTEEYHRPSIIFHERDDGVLVASARSTEQFNIVQAIAHHKDLLLRYGGHSQAAGCSLDGSKYEAFCDSMKNFTNSLLSDDDLYPVVNIDCELQPEQMTFELKKTLNALEPHGIGNERPLFLLRNLEVCRVNAVGTGGAHVQLWFQVNGKTIKGIAFQQGHLAEKLRQGDRVDVACCLQENTWNGNTSLEIEVVDICKNQERSL